MRFCILRPDRMCQGIFMSTTQHTKAACTTKSEPLPRDLRTHLQRIYERDGERAVLALTRISRNALYRCLAGLGVRRGTEALVREALDGRR
jgi:hypothetical protein